MMELRVVSKWTAICAAESPSATSFRSKSSAPGARQSTLGFFNAHSKQLNKIVELSSAIHGVDVLCYETVS